MARILGIDLGAWAVKVAVMEGSFGRFRLVGAHSRRVVSEGGRAPGLPARVEALQALLQEEELTGASTVAIGWPADRASARVVDLPFDDRAKIERTLPFEVENQVPFDVEQMVLVHRVLARREGGCRVLVGLVDRGEVGARLEALATAGLDPRHLAVDADLLAAWSDGQRGVQAVLDLGHSRCVAALVVDGVTQDLRASQGGGLQVDQHLRAAFGFDPDLAEAWRRALTLDPGSDTAVPVEVGWDDDERTLPGAPVPAGATAALATGDQPLAAKGQDPDPAVVGRALREGLRALVAELRTTLISFEDRHKVEIEEVLLTGGLSAQPGLAALLSAELGVPVRLVPPAEPARGREDGGCFALATALARYAAGEARGPFLELRQGDLAHHSALQVLRSLVAYGGAAAVFFALAMGVVAITQQRSLAGRIGEVEAQIAQAVAASFPETDPGILADPTMAVAIMQEETLGTTERVEALKASLRGEPPNLTLLKELSEAMPEASDAVIDVRELTLSETAVSLKADTDGYEQVAKIEASLQAAPRFKGATKGDEKKRGEKVQFTISIPLGVEEAQEADEAEEEG